MKGARPHNSIAMHTKSGYIIIVVYPNIDSNPSTEMCLLIGHHWDTFALFATKLVNAAQAFLVPFLGLVVAYSFHYG